MKQFNIFNAVGVPDDEITERQISNGNLAHHEAERELQSEKLRTKLAHMRYRMGEYEQPHTDREILDEILDILIAGID